MKMKTQFKIRELLLVAALLLLLPLLAACGKDKDEPQPRPEVVEPEKVYPEGLSCEPEKANADKPLTIYYKPERNSSLYGYQGDLYLHTGVVSQGKWCFVPAEWTQNISKCKFEYIGKRTWKIQLGETLRQWYGSGDTPLQKLGVVIRTADGKLKAYEEDRFIEVTDEVHKGFVPASVKMKAMPAGLKEGINVTGPAEVTLVLYDRDTEGHRSDYACVTGDFNQWKLTNDDKSQMYRDEEKGCWWLALKGLDSNREYAFQYCLWKGNDVIRLADAYTEKILDPDHDRYIPQTTYDGNLNYPEGGIGIVSTFRIAEEKYNWKVSDFKIENPDNLTIYELLLRDYTEAGNLKGAMAKLDEIERMGFNAVELMPVQEFDGNDSWGYNPCFFFAMDKAYGTKKMYKEFIDACHEKGLAVIFDVVYNHASDNHPFVRLYSKNGKISADNPYFNQKTPHPYGVFNDFNHESPKVREFVKRNLLFLLDEYHIDGFRFDLAKGFTQKQSTEATASKYDASRVEILKDYYRTIAEHKRDAFVVLELFCESREEKELADAGMYLWRNLNNSYCQSGMGYKENSGFGALYMKQPRWVGYMESHDEERVAYKQKQWGVAEIKNSLSLRMQQLEANAAFFFTVPGPKMVWQFGEVGYDESIEKNGRTGKKPLHPEYAEDESRRNLRNVYARLMELRNRHPELFRPSVNFEWKASEAFWNDGRSLKITTVDGKKLVVVANFTSVAAEVPFPDEQGGWTNWMSKKREFVGAKVSLPPHDYRVYVNEQIQE